MKILIYILLSMTLWVTHPSDNPAPCSMAYDGIDLKTKLYTKIMSPAHFFYYTPQELKNDMQTNNLLECKAQLTQIEDQVYLNLNLITFSEKAAREYGSIEMGNILKIKTIDNKTHEIQCRAGSNGQRLNHENKYLYSVSYTLEKSDIKGLLKSEIDKIGIQWSSGFEEYTIYEIDLIKNQLTCLNL